MNKRKNINIKPKRDYDEYLARKILNDIKSLKSIDLIKSSYFNKLELIDFPSIFTLFNSILDQSLKEDLLNLTLLSRSSKEIDLACSNAITILAKSDFSFNNRDLSSVRIPKADLSQCLFINVNFENSSLKEVKFLQSQFHNVNFKNCDLRCAKFGLAMEINSQQGIGLNFSDNDDYFYYKTEDTVMEIDLKSQESKIISSLSDFVSSYITKIHSNSKNPYISYTHGQYLGIYTELQKKLKFDINMTKLAFSPNWKYLATLNNKSIVLCWDTEKQVLGEKRATTYRGAQLAFSPCSRYLAIVRTTCIYLIKTGTWTLFRSIPGKYSAKDVLAFSYCGKQIAFTDSGSVYLINTTAGERHIIYQIYLKHKTARGLSFSPCGTFLVFESNESNIYVMNINSRNVIQTFTGFESNVLSVIFSISGKYISLSDSEGNIKIFEFFPKFIKNDYNRHFKIHDAKVSPKGTYLLTTSSAKWVLWDMKTFNPKQIKTFTSYRYFDLFAFSPSDTYLALRKYPTNQIYDIKHDSWLKPIKLDYWCFYLSFSHCEKFLICLNGTCYEYFSIPDMQIVRKVSIPQPDFKSLKFSECGKYHYWTDSRSALHVWNLEKDYFVEWNYSILQSSNYAFTSRLEQIALSNEISQERDCLEIWFRNNVTPFSLVAKGEKLSFCCFSPNKKMVAAGYESGIIFIWDISTESIKEKIRSLLGRAKD